MNFRKVAALGFMVLFLGGCGINLVPSKDDWYAKHYYIMQDFEWKLYKELSPAARLEFQKMSWEVRTPEAKAEFDKRVEYCMKAYKKENSRQPFNVDKAHVFLLNGAPAQIEYAQNTNWTMKAIEGGQGAVGVSDRSGEDVAGNMAEVWTYRYGQWLVKYVFAFRSPNEWKLVSQAAVGDSRYLGRLELENKNDLYGIKDLDEYKQKLEALKAIK
jgi:GWxTD domain-containing protein